ncbi:unnamed protein product [Phytophthora fragariaefolia]|uniref:Unnamed protein product n=1 Tax=Phytophthora fragariaefolia TaxID=1490495 RepID=A0A9W6WYS3_9STRA|nr:unnamed protein product [Phytophthora fragariaefolia]
MNKEMLTRELVCARLRDLAEMKVGLEEIRGLLEKILAVQMEYQARIEEEEDRGYQLAAALREGNNMGNDVQSFGTLLEMAVKRLQGIRKGGSCIRT